MAGPYATLSDDALVAKLATFEAAQDKAALGGTMRSIAGEGRKREFNAPDAAVLFNTLRELRAEVGRRPSLSPNGPCGGSLAVEIGRSNYFGAGYYGE